MATHPVLRGVKSSLLLLERLEPDLFGGLAMEDHLLDTADAALLFLWRGEKGLVLGKNQNPWREANLPLLQARGLVLARRVSGGGAVVHDPGNLNITWVLDRKNYRADDLHAVLRKALTLLGLESQTTPSGATTVERRKLSGSAYCYRREKVLHHCTLLVDADVETLRAALSVPRIRLQSHAVASVPAQVANLRDFLPQLTLQNVVEALKRAAHDCGFLVETCPDFNPVVPETARRRMCDPAWVWDQTPRFSGELRLDGDVLHFQVAKGALERLDWKGENLPAGSGLRFDADLPARLAGILGHDAEDLRHHFAEQGWSWSQRPV